MKIRIPLPTLVVWLICSSACAGYENVSLEKYESGVAVFQVGVCPIDAKIDVDVKFTPSSDPSLAYAELSFHVPSQQCYANTSQRVTVNIQEKIKEVALLKGLKSSIILMKSIPNRIEVDQF